MTNHVTCGFCGESNTDNDKQYIRGTNTGIICTECIIDCNTLITKYAIAKKKQLQLVAS